MPLRDPSVAPLPQDDHAWQLRSLPRCPAAPLAIWQLWIDHTPRPGWANMAIDQTLLERAEQLGESWLRLYQWMPHCLSFGRHEPAARRYDRERIAELGLDTVRRPTGGRAVWHAQELTYALAAPSLRFGSLKAAYLEIHGMLADALRWLGAPASLAPAIRTPPLDAGACFAQPAGGEIMVGGRKVVGSAQLRQGGAFLQHGSVLLQDNQQVVLDVVRGAHEVQVPEASDRSFGIAEVVGAVTRSAQERWPGAWERFSNRELVLSGASSHYPRYRSLAWTWVR